MDSSSGIVIRPLSSNRSRLSNRTLGQRDVTASSRSKISYHIFRVNKPPVSRDCESEDFYDSVSSPLLQNTSIVADPKQDYLAICKLKRTLVIL